MLVEFENKIYISVVIKNPKQNVFASSNCSIQTVLNIQEDIQVICIIFKQTDIEIDYLTDLCVNKVAFYDIILIVYQFS